MPNSTKASRDEQIQEMKREVQERYDPDLVRVADRNVRNMSKAQFQGVKEEGEAIAREMAELMEQDVASPEVQALIARHHALNEQFYPTSAEMYRGLGQMYTQDDRFRAYYDKYRPGLADFMAAAMAYYAENTLAD